MEMNVIRADNRGGDSTMRNLLVNWATPFLSVGQAPRSQFSL